jgi:hypothetical protein
MDDYDVINDHYKHNDHNDSNHNYHADIYHNDRLRMDMNAGMIYYNNVDDNDIDHGHSHNHNKKAHITIYNVNNPPTFGNINTSNSINNKNKININHSNISTTIDSSRNHNDASTKQYTSISITPPALFTHENSIANYLNKLSSYQTNNNNNNNNNTGSNDRGHHINDGDDDDDDVRTNISSSHHALLKRNVTFASSSSSKMNAPKQDDLKLLSLLG